jgi:hypothetical protein
MRKILEQNKKNGLRTHIAVVRKGKKIIRTVEHRFNEQGQLDYIRIKGIVR